MRRRPTIPGVPIAGSALDLLRDPVGFFVDAAARHGPVFDLRILHHELTVVTGDAAVELASDDAGGPLTRDGLFSTFRDELGAAIFSAEGPAHQRLRRLLGLSLSRAVAAEAAPQIARDVMHRVRTFNRGHRFDGQALLADLAVVGALRALSPADLTAHVGDFVVFSRRVMDVTIGLLPAVTLRDPWYRAARRRALAAVEGAISAHRAGRFAARQETSILDALLQVRDAEGRPLTDEEVRGAALYTILGACAYTGTVAAWMVYEALRNPTLLERVQAEVDAGSADGPPSAVTLRRMAHLRALFLETLRVHPLLLGMPYRVRRPLDVAGITIPVDRNVLLCPVASHFDAAHHPDPMRFDADRMLPPRDESRRREAFAPFGAGNRVCLARGHVEVMATALVAALLRTVRIALPRPTFTARPTLAPLVAPAQGLPLRVIEQRPPGLRPARAVALDAGDALGEGGSLDLPAMSERLVPSGEIVQRAGDPADAFVVVLDGAVTASLPGGGAAPALGPGDTFGDVGLLKGAPRAETLRTTRTSRLLVLPRDAFVALVTEHDLLPTEIGALMRRRHVATLLAGALPGLERDRLGVAAAETTFFVADVGAVIVHQGDTADAFYVVVDGRTEVLRDGPAGVQQVAEIGPGEFFGEAGLLRALPRSATVRASERAELLRVTRVGFDALVSGTEPRGGIARAMVERLLRDAK